MTKRNKDDEVSKLEKQIRELKATNRSLLRRLKKVDRRNFEEYEEGLTSEEEFTPVVQTIDKCEDCSEDMTLVVLAGRRWKKCNSCGKRTKTEKVQS